jgi:bifunctional DNA primase/polymerase-like protein
MTRYSDTSNRESKQVFTGQNRKAALEAAAHSQRVFPVNVAPDPRKPTKKKADIPVKWMKEATTDAARINKWWDIRIHDLGFSGAALGVFQGLDAGAGFKRRREPLG